MKKILFPLVALVGTMSMNAQIVKPGMEIMKNGVVVATYTADQADEVVFKEVTIPTTGTAKATINGVETDVNWVQLWENGPKFAEYNVGVTDGKAENYGGYYTWGGTYKNGKGIDWSDDHNTGESDLIYTGNDDGITITDTATKLWGSNWRMPKQAELEALLDNCDVEWTTINGVNGRKFTGQGDYSSNSVFLPAAGDCTDGDVHVQGNDGYYWSSSPYGSSDAYYLLFDSGSQDVNDNDRNDGYSVRAVLAE